MDSLAMHYGFAQLRNLRSLACVAVARVLGDVHGLLRAAPGRWLREEARTRCADEHEQRTEEPA